MNKWTDATQESMGGEDHAGHKPKKEIKEIHTSKSENGDHIHVHHHTHPGHHPSETHTTRGDDEMVAHMMQNMGTQNPGEAAADPNAAPADASGATPAGAAPAAGAVAPTGSGV